MTGSRADLREGAAANAPDVLADIARGWNRSPSGVASGTGRTGLSAALWSNDADDVQEVWGEPDGYNHHVSIPLTDCFSDLRKDGRQVFARAVRRKSVQLMEAGVRPHSILRGPWTILHLYVPAGLVDEIATSDGGVGCPTGVELIDPECAQDPLIAHIGNEVLAEMREDRPLSRLRVDSLGQDLAVQLLRRHSNLAGTKALALERAAGGLAPYRLRRIEELMRDRLADDLGLDGLAREAGLSPFHFARAFKKETGRTPHRYVLERRIERAKELLVASDEPISTIAKRVGFASQAGLTAAFRRLSTETPGAYRRSRSM